MPGWKISKRWPCRLTKCGSPEAETLMVVGAGVGPVGPVVVRSSHWPHSLQTWLAEYPWSASTSQLWWLGPLDSYVAHGPKPAFQVFESPMHEGRVPVEEEVVDEDEVVEDEVVEDESPPGPPGPVVEMSNIPWLAGVVEEVEEEVVEGVVVGTALHAPHWLHTWAAEKPWSASESQES